MPTGRPAVAVHLAVGVFPGVGLSGPAPPRIDPAVAGLAVAAAGLVGRWHVVRLGDAGPRQDAEVVSRFSRIFAALPRSSRR